MQLDLQNAEYYQIGFRDFVELKWNQAITNLEKIVAVDRNYAGGNARILLAESYFLLGDQYFSAGFYQDALNNLEQAELLTWEDRNNNLMRFFETQILIVHTLGELEEYENAVSYYRYASNEINLYGKLNSQSTLFTKFLEANDLFAAENLEAAYETFREVLENVDGVFATQEIEIEQNRVLAFLAEENQSTVNAILEASDLPKTMTVKRRQVLIIPSLQR